MTTRNLLYNGKILTQAEGVKADSMAVYKNRIVGVGTNLQHDPDFARFHHVDLKGKTVVPGLVDAHTHFYYFALSLGRAVLHEADSIGACLNILKKHAARLGRNEWVVGEGYTPDKFKNREEPDRYQIDNVTGGRPAFVFSKDEHSAWVNSRALEFAGITARTKDPQGGEIVRLPNGEPSGILREGAGYGRVFELIPQPSKAKIDKLFRQATQFAYENGVTGVHSVDGQAGFVYMSDLAQKNKLGLRVTYYFPAMMLPTLHKNRTYYGTGTDFFRVAGIKLFADGSLGSQTALCFSKYIGSKDNYGIEVLSTKKMAQAVKSAAKLGFPCAIHAIGDKAVSNVLDAFEESPKPYFGARHRIEHVQLIRRKDIARMKRMQIVASVQPTHCTSDIEMVRKYWGARGKNAYAFQSMLRSGVDLAFGSDCPIEPLKPLDGIAAAVNRARKGSRDVFYKDERVSVEQALYYYTVGPAIAAGEAHFRGYLLPGYPADFVVLSEDISRISAMKLYDVKVLATVLDGKLKFRRPGAPAFG